VLVGNTFKVGAGEKVTYETENSEQHRTIVKRGNNHTGIKKLI